MQRWTLYDPSTAELYTFPYNPREMGSLFGSRNVTSRSTTAVDGQAILFEGNRQPTQWSFSGFLLDHQSHEALRSWALDRTGRLQLTDHFGRVIELVMTGFESTPRRDRNRYWRHEYTVRALVLSVGPATVGV